MSKKKTETSSFGVSKRESHDASKFYGLNPFKNIVTDEKLPETTNPIDPKILDHLLCQDSRQLPLPNSSVHLMVTSPPYNVGKDYDANLTHEEYLAKLTQVFAETYRVLVNGGRACINIANVGRKPYIPYHKYIIDIMTSLGFLMRGEVIWIKAKASSGSCAWGSWMSASNPTLRDTHEYILVFSKGKFGRSVDGKENTITKEQFLAYTNAVWTFNPESAKRVGHPAPFPVELPYRCIQLYTFQGDVVLDPFAGIGTTAIAAIRSDRHFIACDTNSEYVASAQERIRQFREIKTLEEANQQAEIDEDIGKAEAELQDEELNNEEDVQF